MVATLLLTFCLSLPTDLPIAPDDDPFKFTEDMKLFLEQNIDRSVDSVEQLRTLVRVVFQQNALNFTYVPETRTAAETFNKRGGNCASFTFLFLAMARHLGFDARFREVDIVPTWSQVGNIISMNGHANAAVFIGGQGYVVDLFPRVDRIDIRGRVVPDERAERIFSTIVELTIWPLAARSRRLPISKKRWRVIPRPLSSGPTSGSLGHCLESSTRR
jgi:hypothetical protein